ncbi:unnamed protein product [Brassicogethes aeneus]|uniref:Uncharacterized protein n=1 Tax=Brassicogethes aeneus TaxID=1431903 RepID=A0A9P0BCG5_BRAAE|nr:unnamed protein product [Brassicogethes aeneus]
MAEEIEQVRNLAAISAGQELMPKYTEMILKTTRRGVEGMENMERLIDWKDIREPFWTEEEASIPSGDSKSFEELSLGFNDISSNITSISEEEDETEGLEIIHEVEDIPISTGDYEFDEDFYGEEDQITEEEILIDDEEISIATDESSCENSWIKVDLYQVPKLPIQMKRIQKDVKIKVLKNDHKIRFK